MNNFDALYLKLSLSAVYACVCSTGTRVRVVFSPLHPLLPYISIPRSVTLEPLQLVSVSAPSGLADLMFYIHFNL